MNLPEPKLIMKIVSSRIIIDPIPLTRQEREVNYQRSHIPCKVAPVAIAFGVLVPSLTCLWTRFKHSIFLSYSKSSSGARMIHSKMLYSQTSCCICIWSLSGSSTIAIVIQIDLKLNIQLLPPSITTKRCVCCNRKRYGTSVWMRARKICDSVTKYKLAPTARNLVNTKHSFNTTSSVSLCSAFADYHLVSMPE